MGNQVSLARSKVLKGKKLKTYLRRNPHHINQLKQYENLNCETFLTIAIRGRRLDDVKFLLSKGADPNVEVSLIKPLQYNRYYRIHPLHIFILNVYQRKRDGLWTAIHEVCLLKG